MTHNTESMNKENSCYTSVSTVKYKTEGPPAPRQSRHQRCAPVPNKAGLGSGTHTVHTRRCPLLKPVSLSAHTLVNSVATAFKEPTRGHSTGLIIPLLLGTQAAFFT